MRPHDPSAHFDHACSICSMQGAFLLCLESVCMALARLDAQYITVLCSSLLQAGNCDCHVVEAANGGAGAAASGRGAGQAACRSLHQRPRDTAGVILQALVSHMDI